MKFCIFNLLILCILLASCRTARKQTTLEHIHKTNKLDSCNVDCVKFKITNNQNLHYFTGKGTIRYQFEQDHQEARIILYGIKDSLCLISLKKLGVEAYRVLLLPDRIYVIDRLNQEYSNLNYSDLENQHQMEIKFDWIQDFLSSACFIAEDLVYQLTDSILNFKLLGKSDAYSLEYKLNNPETLCEEFKLYNSKYALHIQAKDYLNLENTAIPLNIQIGFKSVNRSVLNLELNWDEIKLEPIHQIKFNIPDHYKKL